MLDELPDHSDTAVPIDAGALVSDGYGGPPALCRAAPFGRKAEPET